jgi:hypothetical protein
MKRDHDTIERILNAIAIRPHLAQQFADILGMKRDEFQEWVELAQVPELPEKLFVACSPRREIYGVHTTMDRIQSQVDKLTMEFGTGFIIVESPLNP